MASRFEQSILRSLRRITRAIDLHSRQLAKHHALTGPQLVCLLGLQDGPRTPTALADAVSLSQATVSGILKRLEERELIERRRRAEDRRSVEIALTELGRQTIERAPSPLSERFSGRLENLPEGEQAMIDWILDRIVHLMEADDVDAAPVLTTGNVTADEEEVAEFLDPDE